MIAGQVHNDEERPRSSWEVSLWVKVQVQITGVHGTGMAVGPAKPRQQNLSFSPLPQEEMADPGQGLPAGAYGSPCPTGTT